MLIGESVRVSGSFFEGPGIFRKGREDLVR